MKGKNTLYMETTVVPVVKTAAEITGLLVKSGATRVETNYESGKITGLRWTIRVAGTELLYSMPARVGTVFEIFRKRRKRTISRAELENLKEQAERVAWRQLLRWVQAQIAMIECGMTDSSEVFFAYLTHPETGKTVYSVFVDQKFKMLAPPQ
jgi:hypothetical protein